MQTSPCHSTSKLSSSRHHNDMKPFHMYWKNMRPSDFYFQFIVFISLHESNDNGRKFWASPNVISVCFWIYFEKKKMDCNEFVMNKWNYNRIPIMSEQCRDVLFTLKFWTFPNALFCTDSVEYCSHTPALPLITLKIVDFL